MKSRFLVLALVLTRFAISSSGAEDATRSSGSVQAVRLPALGSRSALTAAPSALEISQAHFFEEPLMPSREPTTAENETLLAALERFRQRAVRDDFSSLTEFLERDPTHRGHWHWKLSWGVSITASGATRRPSPPGNACGSQAGRRPEKFRLFTQIAPGANLP